MLRPTPSDATALAAIAEPTWGIPGPVFLAVYLILTVAVLAVTTTRRRSLLRGRGPGGGSAIPLAQRPYDVAYLAGGPDRATLTALRLLHTTGRVRVAAGRIRSDPPRGAEYGEVVDALEHAVLAQGPTSIRRLPQVPAVAAALRGIDDRLAAEGLLVSAALRSRVQVVGWVTMAVAALGVARLVAGLGDGRPVLLLLPMVLVVAAVAGVQLTRAPRLTAAGRHTLGRLRQDHALFGPELHPDWTVHGPVAAALAVGLFGAAALWDADPAFAADVALQRPADGTATGSTTSGCAARAGGSDGGASSCGGGGGGCGGGCGGG